MDYKSYKDLVQDVCAWSQQLPGNLDLIVGIPRSGMLVANMLALLLNKPLTDVEGVRENRFIGTRKGRATPLDCETFFRKPLNILLVDDSVFGGDSIKKARRFLFETANHYRVNLASLYITSWSRNLVDCYYEVLSSDRIFEWNLMHHKILKDACVDIDGVLCRDPTNEENDDGDNYRHFIRSVRPLRIPTIEIGWLVTNRLEKYRDDTVQWLKRHGIPYRELIMLDLPDLKNRRELKPYVSYKAEVFKRSKAMLFVESSMIQAIGIAEKTRKPVLCYESGVLIKESNIKEKIDALKRIVKLDSRHHLYLFLKRIQNKLSRMRSRSD